MTSLIPISIYIHIPFCVKKCRYCDFLSSVSTEDERSYYVQKLCEEIQADNLDGYIIDTVFFGGGTPSILKAEEIEKILCKLKERFIFVNNPEISIECNPGMVDITKLTSYQKMGINRISIGAQSFDDEELRLLGRIHDKNQIIKAADDAKTAGFNNINLDIISSVPGQDEKSFKNTLLQALSLKCQHYSVYSLIVEPGTWIYENQDKLSFPSEETEMKIDEITENALIENGFKRYEISNYALPGFECRHNLTYWNRGYYRGYGLGAASLLLNGEGEEFRFNAEDNFKAYYSDYNKPFKDRKRASEYKILKPDEIGSEHMFLGLRLIDGVSLGKYESIYSDIINTHLLKGLTEFVIIDGIKRYRLSKKGLKVANYVMADYC